ncbi:MAG TPA: hypothetical protein VJC12_02335 [Candidatus Paceibacterota bacterium]
MKLYEVIPIAKGISRETLSYFGGDNIELGALVSIPLRKKNINALVVGSSEVVNERAKIRTSPYKLRKIEKVLSKNFITPAFFESAKETAQYFGTTTGAVLGHVLPKQIIEESIRKNGKEKSERRKENLTREPLVFQTENEERIAHYKSLIREEFARNSSVFICLPTIEDINFYKILLGKGIEKYTAILNSSLTKKEFANQIKKIHDEDHPVLILGTPPFLSIQRKDISTIVLDRENSRGYRTQSRPFIDLRYFVEKFAKNHKNRLILADCVLSIETMFRFKNEQFQEYFSVKTRYPSQANAMLIKMNKKRDDTEKEKSEFKILSRELESLIDRNIADNEKLIIFGARKGLSPITLCGDCGQSVSCPRCQTPMVLYGKEAANYFKCNRCTETLSSDQKCSNCGGWRLMTLGVAVENVEKEIKKKFTEAKIFRLDRENVKTDKKARDLVKKFIAEPGSILLGTELMLLQYKGKTENVAVASIDSLISLPDFRINERIFYLLIALRARAQNVFVIQTRNPENKIFEHALSGNLNEFFNQEIKDRKEFNYPPFSLIIKLSLEGRKPTVSNEAQKIALLLNKWSPTPFQGEPSKRGNAVMNILLRLKPENWPNEELLRILISLPQQVAIRIDPESLL